MKTIALEKLPIYKIKQEIMSSISKNIDIEEYNKQGKLLHKYNGKIVSAHDNVLLLKLNLNGYTLNRSFTYVDFSIGELHYIITNSVSN